MTDTMMPVGRVVEVSSPLDELFKQISVEPYAEFNVNERVFVVAGQTEQGGGSPP